MQALLTETKAKETILQKRRNLFGLGVTSLIAACADGEGDGDPVTLPFEAEKAEKAEKLAEATDSGFTATISGTDSLTVEVKEAEATKATLVFSEADNALPNTVNIYQLTSTENQYDLVISAPTIDKNEKIGTTDDNNPEYRKGKIFIYWDIANITDKDSTHLEIKGATKEDQIGTFAPDFLQLTGTDNNYDMVIRSSWVDKAVSASKTYEGAIYILWDVADYKTGTTKTIDLGKLGEDGAPNLNATAGSLAIYGLITGDNIGIHAPEFLQIGGTDNNYDMVIRSENIDKPDGPDSLIDNEGGIFILWDFADYKTSILNKTIILDSSLESNADYGLLAIYGGVKNLALGTYAPDFLELGGKDNNYDIVIRTPVNKGIIYILWDIEDYYKDADEKIAHKRIDLDKLGDTNNAALDATAGSLAIYGVIRNDGIGIHTSEFLQIGGKDNNYDMVIRSHKVDKEGDGGSPYPNEGAIYVLWDVADYYGTEASPNNKSIDLGADATTNADIYATSGLLTIYGAAREARLGNDDNNVLYSDDDGSKILTNIDNDTAGTKDIAFRDGSYTYILFGDKVAEVDTGTGKVDSKTIDLSTLDGILGANVAGFFNYTFVAGGLGTAAASTSATDRVGYRFVGREADLDAVQAAYDALPSSLSDTDSDLGVWDIA